MPRFATLDKEEKLSAVLKVIGVGGGGCNAIESMINRGLGGVEYIAINTDNQALLKNSAPVKIQIGRNKTRGLGAGADPNIGKEAAEEDRENIQKMLEGSDMVFVTAGMGGGTGTGAAPLVASIAKSLGVLVVGIVTKPFKWEGKKRMLNAEQGIHELKQYVDSLIVIPNERLIGIIDNQRNAFVAFDKPNEVLYEATRGIADIITVSGMINVDFADVRSVMSGSGEALMGCGIASGENRAIEAAQKAISSPLLEGVSIRGAKNILLNITASNNLTMQELYEGNNVIYEAAGEDANIIFGLVERDEMNENVSYTVIATGFNNIQKPILPASLTNNTNFEKKKEPVMPTAGFSLGNYSAQDSNNLEVPTIIRYKGNSNLIDSFKLPSSGYSIENLPIDSEKSNDIRNESKNDFGEEDSSSFLRKMMD